MHSRCLLRAAPSTPRRPEAPRRARRAAAATRPAGPAPSPRARLAHRRTKQRPGAQGELDSGTRVCRQDVGAPLLERFDAALEGFEATERFAVIEVDGVG